MSKRLILPFTLALSAAAAAQAPQVQISIGVRETGAAGTPFTFVGDNGGITGGIEWVNRDGQTLTLDGTWQYFQFNLATDPITAFAGTTANGVIEGLSGTLENIRVVNFQGITTPISLWVDDVQNTYTPSGGGPTTVVFGTFEPYAQGTEVMIQEPGFSGSTSANLVLTPPGTSGVDNFVAARTPSCKTSFQFIDGTTTRWVRLTTFNTVNLRNPMVSFEGGATIGFWMRGGVGQPNLGSQGPGSVTAEICGQGLAANQSSTYYTAGAGAAVPGVMLISLYGLPDLPIFGGNLVSFGGLLVSIGLPSDNNGRSSFAIPGDAAVYDLVFQSAFVDFNQPEFFAFSNAVQAQFGR